MGLTTDPADPRLTHGPDPTCEHDGMVCCGEPGAVSDTEGPQGWPVLVDLDGEPVEVTWRQVGPGRHLGGPVGCTCGAEHPFVPVPDLLEVVLPGDGWAETRRELLAGGESDV